MLFRCVESFCFWCIALFCLVWLQTFCSCLISTGNAFEKELELYSASYCFTCYQVITKCFQYILMTTLKVWRDCNFIKFHSLMFVVIWLFQEWNYNLCCQCDHYVFFFFLKDMFVFFWTQINNYCWLGLKFNNIFKLKFYNL